MMNSLAFVRSFDRNVNKYLYAFIINYLQVASSVGELPSHVIPEDPIVAFHSMSGRAGSGITTLIRFL